MVASLVDKGSRVADIGTDHAYLPVYLILNGISLCCFASDINPGPLENAKKTAEKYGCDNISLFLSDGLENVPLKSVDTLIFAGMGGDLIVDILHKADYCSVRYKTIITQVQSHAEKVRLFLLQNGFTIAEETACRDTGKLYSAIKFVPGFPDFIPEGYEYYGELINSKSPEAKDILLKTASSLKIKAEHSNDDIFIKTVNSAIKTIDSKVGSEYD